METDHFLEECTSSIYYEANNIHHYPCHYLDLWMRYNRGDVYDTSHFLDTFFTASTCLAIAYIFSCFSAIVGLLRSLDIFVIPWIGVNIFIALCLSLLIFAEVHLKTNPDIHLSMYFYIAFVSLIYMVFNAVVGIVLWLQIRQKKQKQDDFERFTNIELDTFHNPSDSLSWF